LISRDEAKRIADRWIGDWNAHDLDAILSHYAEELEFTSPLITERLGRADGTIRSKAELKSYFAVGVAPGSELKFELLDVMHGVTSLALHYRNQAGRTITETMFFDENGKVAKVAVHWSIRTG
jgi:ketosteroid isomerase-like protein